jgi:hypothetical protein
MPKWLTPTMLTSAKVVAFGFHEAHGENFGWLYERAKTGKRL